MIYLACPCYNGMSAATHKATLQATQKYDVIQSIKDYSSLTLNFNSLWCDMLNIRKQHNITHFVMIHSDIDVKTDAWLDKMVQMCDETNCDVLSVVSPLKDNRGLVSTGVWDTQEQVVKYRLTMTQVGKLPEVFDVVDVLSQQDQMKTHINNFNSVRDFHLKLAVNTGLMLVKVEDWCEKVHFRQHDYVIKKTFSDGTVEFVPQFISEDWLFSADVQQLGKVVKGTKAIKIEHIGKFGYANFGVWGTLQEDDLS